MEMNHILVVEAPIVMMGMEHTIHKRFKNIKSATFPKKRVTPLSIQFIFLLSFLLFFYYYNMPFYGMKHFFPKNVEKPPGSESNCHLLCPCYIFLYKKTGQKQLHFCFRPVCMKKAGDGNRTHVSSLEGWCSTIELHPHVSLFFCVPQDKNYNITRLHKMQPLFSNFFNFFNYI